MRFYSSHQASHSKGASNTCIPKLPGFTGTHYIFHSIYGNSFSSWNDEIYLLCWAQGACPNEACVKAHIILQNITSPKINESLFLWNDITASLCDSNCWKDTGIYFLHELDLRWIWGWSPTCRNIISTLWSHQKGKKYQQLEAFWHAVNH